MKDQLLKLLSSLGLTASRFADEIGVQRSGISHILSGRNQPSYDFIIKIINRYPELSPDWILLGKGSMLRNESKEIALKQDLFTGKNTSAKEIPSATINREPGKRESDNKNDIKVTNVTSIEQVILFYTDGTFKPYVHPAEDKI